MIKKIVLASFLMFSSAHFALAGDTVTITAPGGATSSIASSVLAAAITSAGRAIGLSGGSSVASITQAAPNANGTPGDITITTTGGQVFVVTSSFIGSLMAFYA